MRVDFLLRHCIRLSTKHGLQQHTSKILKLTAMIIYISKLKEITWNLSSLFIHIKNWLEKSIKKCMDTIERQKNWEQGKGSSVIFSVFTSSKNNQVKNILQTAFITCKKWCCSLSYFLNECSNFSLVLEFSFIVLILTKNQNNLLTQLIKMHLFTIYVIYIIMASATTLWEKSYLLINF